MFETIKQLIKLALKSKKWWLLPAFLFLVIVALLVIGAHLSPVPVFLYPLI